MVPVGQVPDWQRPAPPAGAPQGLPAQETGQTHWPARQVLPVGQGLGQTQESMHWPLLHSLPCCR